MKTLTQLAAENAGTEKADIFQFLLRVRSVVEDFRREEQAVLPAAPNPYGFDLGEWAEEWVKRQNGEG